MTSEELRSKGFKTNNQLRDQRAAYRWIKQHIEGFGGDADNITVIGESAGAGMFLLPLPSLCLVDVSKTNAGPTAATTLQLYSKEKIFNRVIATGGSCLLTPTLPKEACEDMYTKALGFLGLESLSVDERIQKLLTLPADEIIAKLPPFVQFAPMLDDEIVPVRPTYASIGDPSDKSMPGKDWADAIMIGDSQFDVSRPPSPHSLPGDGDTIPKKLPDVMLTFFVIGTGLRPRFSHGSFETQLPREVLNFSPQDVCIEPQDRRNIDRSVFPRRQGCRRRRRSVIQKLPEIRQRHRLLLVHVDFCTGLARGQTGVHVFPERAQPLAGRLPRGDDPRPRRGLVVPKLQRQAVGRAKGGRPRVRLGPDEVRRGTGPLGEQHPLSQGGQGVWTVPRQRSRRHESHRRRRISRGREKDDRVGVEQGGWV